VCATVQYAHGNLVVHRDLKPGNILVSEGEVKLLDFGIAKLLGPDTDAPASVTQAYAARLTPQYASPEQIRGQATSTSADVYSLGVILYELLSGRSPYRLEGKTLQEMEQTICTEDPLRASLAVSRVKDTVPADEVARARGLSRSESLSQVLRGDLDWICAKALSKTVEERYISAVALSDDIQRYLEGRPVRAHPQLRGYRFRKFVQRNRVLVGLTSVTAFALIAATVVTLVMFARAREASRLQEQAADRATNALNFVVNSLSGFDPNVAPEVDRRIQVDDIVNRGIAQLKRLDDQPKQQATVMNGLGQVALSLGLTQKADSLYGQALQRLDSLDDAPDFITSLLGLGEVRRAQYRYDDAASYFRRAVNVASAHGDARMLAQSQSALAFSLYNIGGPTRFAEADSLYHVVLRTPDLALDLRADALERLADVEAATLRRDSAISHYDAALRLRSQLLGEESPVYARGLWGPILPLLALNDFRRAETLARDARRILEKNFELYHRDVAWADLYLGYTLDSLQRADTALIVFREAAMIMDSIEPPGSYYAARARFFMGRDYMRLNRLREAEQELRESLRIYALPLDSPNEPFAKAESEYWLGQALREQSNVAQAMRHMQVAYEGFSLLPDRVGQAAQAAEGLAEMYQQLGARDSATAWRQRAINARGR
jgi:serine/threonine-protein kinase